MDFINLLTGSNLPLFPLTYGSNNGLIDYELQQRTNDKNLKREPLVNEVEIDVAGKNIEEVLNEAIEIIDTRESLLDYEYVKPPKELFYSWVFANGLR